MSSSSPNPESGEAYLYKGKDKQQTSKSFHDEAGNATSNQGCDKQTEPNRNGHNKNNVIMQLNDQASATSNPLHMPWFGLDIGGTLVKVVFFDPDEVHPEEEETLNRARLYLKTSRAYGNTGKRDDHLEIPNCVIRNRKGSLHFIRFSTSQMHEFIKLAKHKGLADLIGEVCATGGGADKFEEDIKSELSIRLRKSDELDSVIYGIHYIDKYNPQECYYIQNPLVESKCQRVPYDFSQPYPYLVVNIGSGVSFLAVHSPTVYKRVYGTSIGGGTFVGQCCCLARDQITFDEAIKMAEKGSSKKVDKLVRDIYGGDYAKFGLRGDLVASSFGNMIHPELRNQAKLDDYARGVLEMITLNTASIAKLCCDLQDGVDNVVFVGNFLRGNELSMRLLSYAVDYWSKGEMKALFLQHEGYFGAVGCLVESTQGLI